MRGSNSCCDFAYREKPNLDAHLQFEINVYKFCDENVGERVLFPFFMSMWPYERLEVERYQDAYYVNKDGKPEISVRTMSTKDIANIASRIVNELIKFEVVEEVPLPVKVDTEWGFLVSNVKVPYFSGYAYYEILHHSPLIERKKR